MPFPDIPESGGEYIGAAGQFVSAVLQTAGIFGQARILKNFTEIIEHLGAGFFAIGVFGAILSVALFGNYKKALFLLIGPPLFFFALRTTVPAASTRLMFGERGETASDKEQYKFLERMDYSPSEKGPYNVAWFYVFVDNLASSVVQQTVAVLIDNKNKEDLVSIANERAYSQLFSASSTDPLYLRLVSKGMVGQCAEAMNKSLALGRVRGQIAKEDGASPESAARKDALNTDAGVLAKQLNDINSKKVIALDDELQNLQELYGEQKSSPVSCGEVWALVKKGTLKEADRIVAQSVKDAIKDPLSDYSAAPEAEVKKKLLKTLSEAGTDQEAYNIAAAYILRNALSNTSHDAFAKNLAGRARFSNLKRVGIYGQIADAESKGGFLKLMHFAAVIPYVQGLLLYVLSLAFPFFCLFLLMPSRMSSFFIWPALWIWVKSWDVGFAVTHVVRDILWHYVSHGINKSNAPLDWSDSSSVFALVYNNDPLATLNTYYTVLGIATFAVPMLTAHCCLGATDLLGSIKGMLEDPSNRFSKQYGNKWRRFQVSSTTEALIKKRMEEVGLKAAEAKARSDDPEMQAIRRSGNGAAYSRALEGAARRAKYDYHFTDENMMMRSFLGAASGRPMTYSNQMNKEVSEADLDRVNRAFDLRPAGLEGNKYGGLVDPLDEANKYYNAQNESPDISGVDNAVDTSLTDGGS